MIPYSHKMSQLDFIGPFKSCIFWMGEVKVGQLIVTKDSKYDKPHIYVIFTNDPIPLRGMWEFYQFLSCMFHMLQINTSISHVICRIY